MAQTAKRETQGMPLRVRVRRHADPLVRAAPCTLAESTAASACDAGGACGRGQAHLHAAICTTQGAGHKIQGVCEIHPHNISPGITLLMLMAIFSHFFKKNIGVFSQRLPRFSILD